MLSIDEEMRWRRAPFHRMAIAIAIDDNLPDQKIISIESTLRLTYQVLRMSGMEQRKALDQINVKFCRMPVKVVD